jgi:hypothetical protein
MLNPHISVNRSPKKIAENKIYFFTHIQKTGGMSVYETFKENIDCGQLIGDGAERDFFYATDKILQRKCQCIFGHFRYGFHNLLPIGDIAPVYLTFLRDPVHREASYYFYRRNRSGSLKATLEDVDSVDDLEEWFASPLRPRNVQTHFLCQYPSEPDLELALENMANNYAFVGLTERMDESLELLCRQLSFAKAPPVHVNATPGRPEMCAEQYGRLREILINEDPMDLELYERGKLLFQSRL